MRVTLDPKNPPPLTPEQRKRLDALDERDIDLSDIPEITDEMWARAVRGVSGPSEYYRALKQQITLRLDKDIIAWFKANAERGYQTEINRVLREYVMGRLANAGRRRRS
ncbi:MAG: BrnA antitoxin family protein [Longimicrobiales bacterium]